MTLAACAPIDLLAVAAAAAAGITVAAVGLQLLARRLAGRRRPVSGFAVPEEDEPLGEFVLRPGTPYRRPDSGWRP